jgi:[acyl-carrier-protein] S-malonyltransferase
MTEKIAFVFPGQGSQEVGMGRALAETYPSARQIFDQADEILGFSLSRLCFEGPEADLNDTLNTQAAIFTTTWRRGALEKWIYGQARLRRS